MINPNVSSFFVSAITNIPPTSKKTSDVVEIQKNPILVENSCEGNDSFNFSSTIDVDKYNSCKSPEEILVQLAKDGIVLDEPSYEEPVCGEFQDLDSILPMDLPSVEDPYSYVSDNAFLNPFDSSPLSYGDDISSKPFNSNPFAFGDDTSSFDPFNNNPF